jgi:hypothetical protein
MAWQVGPLQKGAGRFFFLPPPPCCPCLPSTTIEGLMAAAAATTTVAAKTARVALRREKKGLARRALILGSLAPEEGRRGRAERGRSRISPFLSRDAGKRGGLVGVVARAQRAKYWRGRALQLCML